MARVCVADDDGEIGSVVAAFLCEAGYDVEAFDGVDALLERLRTAWEPLIALLDLATPHLDGVAFLAALVLDPALNVRHRLLLLVPWGWGREQDVALLLLQTGVRVIEKPFALDALLNAVGEASRTLADSGV